MMHEFDLNAFPLPELDARGEICKVFDGPPCRTPHPTLHLRPCIIVSSAVHRICANPRRDSSCPPPPKSPASVPPTGSPPGTPRQTTTPTSATPTSLSPTTKSSR